jgi:hypothetical protein
MQHNTSRVLGTIEGLSLAHAVGQGLDLESANGRAELCVRWADRASRRRVAGRAYAAIGAGLPMILILTSIAGSVA